MSNKTGFIAATLLAALAAFPACAETPQKPVAALGDMPMHKVFAAAETEVPFRLKPGKYQVIRIDSDVAAAKIDDGEENVTAVMYGKNSVALFPHHEGAAHITISGKDGNILMARYVIVMPPEQKYIRLQQACRKKGEADCDLTKVYFCPNLCYETHIMDFSKTAAAQ